MFTLISYAPLKLLFSHLILSKIESGIFLKVSSSKAAFIARVDLILEEKAKILEIDFVKGLINVSF